jgi:hypothetical protein
MLADLPFDPNVIIVFVAVIFAAIKALIEKRQKARGDFPETLLEDDPQNDLYEQYEAELERQRAEAGIVFPAEKQLPPPIPSAVQTYIPPSLAPVRKPKLSAAEKAALENFKKQSSPKRKPTNSTRSRVMKHLESPTAAREALLLAEVLGPPKAFHPDNNV